jgi:hypothetical protein
VKSALEAAAVVVFFVLAALAFYVVGGFLV